MKASELRAEIVRNDMTIEELADLIGMGRTTLWRRLGNPDSFTLGEIKAIGKVLRLSGARILEIFFTNKVA